MEQPQAFERLPTYRHQATPDGMTPAHSEVVNLRAHVRQRLPLATALQVYLALLGKIGVVTNGASYYLPCLLDEIAPNLVIYVSKIRVNM
jgi:hypothetical protein